MKRPTKRLTARFVDTVSKAGYHADGDNLYLVVDRSTAKRWAFIYHSHGRRREMGLGRMPLKEARTAAEDIRRQIRSGIDPIAHRRTNRSKAASIPTFKELALQVINDAQRRSDNAKVRYQWELLLGPTYCASILTKPITEVTTLDVEKVLRPVWQQKPETGRKLLSRLVRVFDYARIHLRDAHGIEAFENPATWQDLRHRGFQRPAKLSRGRQAALDYMQAPAFLATLRPRQGLAARALELTLLTGLRTGEVIGAKWSEIDLVGRTWTIPVHRLKDRRTRSDPHRVPLSAEAAALLASLPRLGEHVFPGQRQGKSLSNMAMLGLLKDLNRNQAGKPIWIDPKSGRPITPHGLRATFRTWGEDVGHPRELLEESLGHQVGNAVERAYRRTDGFDRRRVVMQAWADYCAAGAAASAKAA